MTPRRAVPLLIALLFALSAPASHAQDVAAAEAKPASKPGKKKPAKKKTYDYDKSKYKSREEQKSTYKFNDKGEPIRPGKKSPAKKKSSKPPEIGSLEESESCGSADSCAEKKADADAL